MVSHEEREYLYWLCHVPMLGAVTIKRLYDYMGSYKEIYNIEGKELQRLGLLKSSAVSAFEDSKKGRQGVIRNFMV